MNQFVHIQLNTGDVAAAKKFYQGLFDWKMEDLHMGPMTYTMVDAGSKDTGGGIQQKGTPDEPAQWLAYVQVEKVKKAIAKAKSRGATIVVEYQPIPEMGAFGVVVDPTGAVLGVWEPPAAKPKKAARRPKKAPRKAKKR